MTPREAIHASHRTMERSVQLQVRPLERFMPTNAALGYQPDQTYASLPACHTGVRIWRRLTASCAGDISRPPVSGEPGLTLRLTTNAVPRHSQQDPESVCDRSRHTSGIDCSEVSPVYCHTSAHFQGKTNLTGSRQADRSNHQRTPNGRSSRPRKSHLLQS